MGRDASDRARQQTVVVVQEHDPWLRSLAKSPITGRGGATISVLTNIVHFGKRASHQIPCAVRGRIVYHQHFEAWPVLVKSRTDGTVKQVRSIVSCDHYSYAQVKHKFLVSPDSQTPVPWRSSIEPARSHTLSPKTFYY